MVELPVIGEQHFGLSVTSDREAQLRLKGALDLDEPVYYNVGSDGKLRFTLSETTSRTLGRLRTTLLHAGARPTHPPHDALVPRPPTVAHPASAARCPAAPVGPARLRPCARLTRPPAHRAEYFKSNDSAEITVALPLGLPVVRVTLMRVSAEADELRAAVTSYLYSEDRRY